MALALSRHYVNRAVFKWHHVLCEGAVGVVDLEVPRGSDRDLVDDAVLCNGGLVVLVKGEVRVTVGVVRA